MGRKYASERKLPRRDEVRHAQPEAPRFDVEAFLDEFHTPELASPPLPRRKDKKRWCRGKVGREHTPELVFAAAGWMRSASYSCGRPPWKLTSGKPVTTWICRHQEVCSSCGRIMRQSFGRACPDYPAKAAR